MKIINQHLGLPVICLDSSERAGDVIRFITDQVSGRIVAVAVSRRWYQEPSGVLFKDCRAFGQNVVLVSRMDALQPLSQMEEASVHLEAGNDARQRTAITEGGRLLGTVTDEAFDEETGEVVGYRLDILAETGTGRTVYIPHDTFVTSSATVTILQEDVLRRAKDSLEELFGGKPPVPEAGAEPARAAASPETPEPETSEPNAAELETSGPGAWPGAEQMAFATPEDVTDAPPAGQAPSTPGQAAPTPAASTPAAPAPATPAPDISASLDAAALEGALPEEGTGAADDEALFADMTPSDEDLMAEAEDFAPTLPDYVPVTEDDMAGETLQQAPAEQPSGLRPPVEQTPAAAPSSEALEGHNRVMMALSLGRIAGATLRDGAGNVIVEEGRKITMEAAQAAARADKLYDLWTSAQEPPAEG